MLCVVLTESVVGICIFNFLPNNVIVALSSNVIHKMEITKEIYLVSSVWNFFFWGGGSINLPIGALK